MVGGFEKSAALARTARDLGMKVVVTSCFESSVGITALAQFAAAYCEPNVAAGLDTLDRFEGDIIKEPIQTTGGRINIAQACTAARSVDEAAIHPRVAVDLLDTLRGGSRLQIDLPLLIDRDRVVTRREASGMIEQLARKLRARGFDPGSRIAIVENNRIELPLLLLACLEAEVVAVLISPRYPEATRKSMTSSTGCRVAAGWESPSGNAPTEYGIDKLIVPSLASLSDARTNLEGWDGTATKPDLNDPWTIGFTSGSTGTPRAVLLSVGNHHYNALGSSALLAIGPGDRWLLSLPLYHVSGLGILCRCLLGGGAVVLERPGIDLADQIIQDRITHISLVPTQLRRLLRHPELKRLRPSLKTILLGGAPIPPDLLHQACESGLPVYPTYGLTEMASQVATGSPADPRGLRILPNREVVIADDGTICVRGETLFLGYVTQNGIERPVDSDGWFHTGDIGRIDSKGYLRVLGRKDNMFVSGGENVHPEVIEAALSGIDGIEEAVVVPVDDSEFGHRPVAFLRYRADFNLSEAESELSEEAQFGFDHHSLSAELEETLPRFMLPIAYYPWPHGYSPAGIKLDRSFFRDLAARLRRNKR
jgi:O-succinylbenzoic acid--CoA ligase